MTKTIPPPISSLSLRRVTSTGKLVGIASSDLPSSPGKKLKFLDAIIFEATATELPRKIAAGFAARFAQQSQLYRLVTKHWGDFCTKHWGKDRTTIFDWMSASKMWEVLESCSRQPVNHSQLVALRRSIPGREIEVWNAVSNGTDPTERDILDAAKSLNALKPLSRRNASAPQSAPETANIAVLDSAKKAIEECIIVERLLESMREPSIACRVRAIRQLLARLDLQSNPPEPVGILPTTSDQISDIPVQDSNKQPKKETPPSFQVTLEGSNTVVVRFDGPDPRRSILKAQGYRFRSATASWFKTVAPSDAERELELASTAMDRIPDLGPDPEVPV